MRTTFPGKQRPAMHGQNLILVVIHSPDCPKASEEPLYSVRVFTVFMCPAGNRRVRILHEARQAGRPLQRCFRPRTPSSCRRGRGRLARRERGRTPRERGRTRTGPAPAAVSSAKRRLECFTTQRTTFGRNTSGWARYFSERLNQLAARGISLRRGKAWYRGRAWYP